MRDIRKEMTMAKGRLISSEIALDPELNTMSIEALFCYIVAFTNLDRDGLLDAHPNKLWAITCPYKIELLDRMPHIIEEWLRSGKVLRYAVGGSQHALFFKDFRRYNLRMKYHNEAESAFPAPPGWIRSRAGLIPDNKELCERMIVEFDRRSQYREALEQHLNDGLSRQSRGLVARESRQSRDQRQDQDHIQDQENYGGGGDQIIHVHHSVNVDQGGVGGDSLTTFDRCTLSKAAFELGSLLGFHVEWNNYQDYIDHCADHQLCSLLRWIKRYIDDPSASAGLQSLPAAIIAHIRKGTVAHLNGKQEQELIEAIMQFVTSDVWQRKEFIHDIH
ncbi:MAG: hypothetical protein R2932_59180 [Caldilineaceae bacterium]